MNTFRELEIENRRCGKKILGSFPKPFHVAIALRYGIDIRQCAGKVCRETTDEKKEQRRVTEINHLMLFLMKRYPLVNG